MEDGASGVSGSSLPPNKRKDSAAGGGARPKIPKIQRKPKVPCTYVSKEWWKGCTIPTDATGHALGHVGVVRPTQAPFTCPVPPFAHLDGQRETIDDTFDRNVPLATSGTLADAARQAKVPESKIVAQSLQTDISMFAQMVRERRPDLFDRLVSEDKTHLPLGAVLDPYCAGHFLSNQFCAYFPRLLGFNGFFQLHGEERARYFEWLPGVRDEEQPYVQFLSSIGIGRLILPELLHFNPPFEDIDRHMEMIMALIKWVQSKNYRVLFCIVVTVVALKRSTGVSDWVRENDLTVAEIEGATYYNPRTCKMQEITHTTIMIHNCALRSPKPLQAPPKKTRLVTMTPGMIRSCERISDDCHMSKLLQKKESAHAQREREWAERERVWAERERVWAERHAQLKREHEALCATHEHTSRSMLQARRHLELSERAEQKARDLLVDARRDRYRDRY